MNRLLSKKNGLFIPAVLASVCLVSYLYHAPGSLMPSKAGKAPSHIAAEDAEFGKLMQLMQRFSSENIEVFVDGNSYAPRQVMGMVRQYLAQNYDPGDSAESWIREHGHLSPKGNIIYFKYPNGEMEPMRDVFLQELKSLK